MFSFHHQHDRRHHINEGNLRDDAATQHLAANPDHKAAEVGVKIGGDVGEVIPGVRLCRDTHVGRLSSTRGLVLAQATCTSESASGWQQVSFATPVAIQANTNYVMFYYAPVGRYAYDEGYFASAYTKGPLRAPSITEAGGNGVHRCGAGGGFPSSTYRSESYWSMRCSRRHEHQG